MCTPCNMIPWSHTTLAFRFLCGTAPWYLAETLHLTTSRSSCSRLRSAATTTLIVPAMRRQTLGDRAFPAAAARAWNSLPSFVRNKQSPPAFRQQLKTVLFKTSFCEDIYARVFYSALVFFLSLTSLNFVFEHIQYATLLTFTISCVRHLCITLCHTASQQ